MRIFKKRVNNHKRTPLLEKQRKREGEALTNMVVPTMSRRTDSKDLKVNMKVKVAQSCLTLCDPMDYTVHGIL